MKKYIISIISALVLSSCGNDFLDSRPTSGIITDLAVTNLQEAKYAINGVYDALSSSSYYGAAIFYIGDVKGDDMQSYQSSSRSANYCYLFDHKSYSLNPSGLWSQPYFVARMCSNILAAFDKGIVKDGTEAERNAVIGQAIALRAMAHFDLTKLFGYPYGKDGGASLGVPIVNHTLTEEEFPNRNTVKECYDFVITELEHAIPMMNTEKDAGKMNAYGARTLLSRAYLYATNYAKSFEVSSKLIEDLVSSKAYELYTNANYMDAFAFNAKLGSESLVEIVNSANDNQSWDCLAYLIHPFGYRENILTADFEALMKADPNDVRIGMVRNVSQYNNRPFLNKYPGSAANTASRENNYPVIRLSEVYLIAAEAATHLSGVERAKGLGYLNVIVQRGNPANVVTDVQYDLDRVLTERRKELVGEGHRYFDMLRNGKMIVRKGGYHLDNAPEEIDWNFTKCVLPIPAAQFTFNPAMDQNPGYTRE